MVETKEEILKKIEEVKKLKKELQFNIKDFVKDTTIALEVRWRIFCKSGELEIIPKYGYYYHPKGLNWDKIALYDNFGIDRDQTYNVSSLYDDAIKNGLFKEGDENSILFKESCMRDFKYSCENDW